MIVIRKFVGYAGGAVGVCGALLLSTSTSTGIAASPSPGASVRPAAQLTSTQTPTITLSPACAAAWQNLKAAAQADRSEDALERAAALAAPDLAADRTEDGTEIANFRSLFAGIRTACAPASPIVKGSAPTTKPTLTSQCTAAIAAVKSFWAQGRPTTQAGWTELFNLFRAVRTACGGADRF